MAHVLPLKQKPLKSILSLAERRSAVATLPASRKRRKRSKTPMNIDNVARERKTNQNAPTRLLERWKTVPSLQKVQFNRIKVHSAPLSDSLAWFLKYRNCASRARQVLCQASTFAQNTGTVPSPQPGLEIFFLFVLDTPFLKWYNPGRLGARGGALFSISPY